MSYFHYTHFSFTLHSIQMSQLLFLKYFYCFMVKKVNPRKEEKKETQLMVKWKGKRFKETEPVWYEENNPHVKRTVMIKETPDYLHIRSGDMCKYIIIKTGVLIQLILSGIRHVCHAAIRSPSSLTPFQMWLCADL